VTDRTGKEHTVKRTAAILGVATALAAPSVASAASSPQVVAQVKPQLNAQVVAQVRAQVRAQVVTARVANMQIARTHRHSTLGTRIVPLGTRIALLRITMR
jgi:hypothetical protein